MHYFIHRDDRPGAKRYVRLLCFNIPSTKYNSFRGEDKIKDESIILVQESGTNPPRAVFEPMACRLGEEVEGESSAEPTALQALLGKRWN